MTPEGRVKARIDKALKALRDAGHLIYWHKPVQNGMGAPTLDYIGCSYGRYFAIEAKAPGEKPTLRQELTMAEIRGAGGQAFVVSEDIHINEFVRWAQEPRL
jgi:hypothetical protein